DQIVKSRDAVQLRRRHLQKLGQVADALIRDPAPAPLNDLQRVNTGGAFLRVLMKLRFDLSSLFFCQHSGLQIGERKIADRKMKDRKMADRKMKDRKMKDRQMCDRETNNVTACTSFIF